jgi:hypothetical protein
MQETDKKKKKKARSRGVVREITFVSERTEVPQAVTVPPHG